MLGPRSLVGDLEKALSCHWTSAALAVAVVWEMNQQMGALFLPLSLSLSVALLLKYIKSLKKQRHFFVFS